MSGLGRPITPKEAKKGHSEAIPPEVYDAFNDLLRKYGSQKTITIKQNEVMDSILKRLPTVKRQEVFDNNWLDIESAYIQNGWDVHYDKPGYNESYEAFWEFSHGKRG